jgi:hypothetical protein
VIGAISLPSLPYELSFLRIEFLVVVLGQGLVDVMKTLISTRLPLVVGMWITGGVTLLGLGSAVVRPKAIAQVSVNLAAPTQLALSSKNCQTVAADPQPPLNVRAEPNAQSSQSIVGTVNNGTVLTVVSSQPQWLQVSQPVAGWVHQPLTNTDCGGSTKQSAATVTMQNPTVQLINTAADRFAAGQLSAALSLLQSIPSTDARYDQAQQTAEQMLTQWQQADRAYQSAHRAVHQGQWQVALNQVKQVPDVRYWRERMAPLVQQAIVAQQAENPV